MEGGRGGDCRSLQRRAPARPRAGRLLAPEGAAPVQCHCAVEARHDAACKGRERIGDGDGHRVSLLRVDQPAGPGRSGRVRDTVVVVCPDRFAASMKPATAEFTSSSTSPGRQPTRAPHLATVVSWCMLEKTRPNSSAPDTSTMKTGRIRANSTTACPARLLRPLALRTRVTSRSLAQRKSSRSQRRRPVRLLTAGQKQSTCQGGACGCTALPARDPRLTRRRWRARRPVGRSTHDRPRAGFFQVGATAAEVAGDGRRRASSEVRRETWHDALESCSATP